MKQETTQEGAKAKRAKFSWPPGTDLGDVDFAELSWTDELDFGE